MFGGSEGDLGIVANKLRGHWSKYVRSWFTRDDASCPVPLTVMMPLAPKDAARADRSIPMIRTHLAHPIERFVLAAPDHPDIHALATRHGVEVLDENVALGSLVGAERAAAMNGWHKQQMLKLAAPLLTGADRVLAIDGDTYPIRRTAFIDGAGRTILHTSDPDLTPWHQFTDAMIGATPGQGISFIAHAMLFEREGLEALYGAIEAHTGLDWIEGLMSWVTRPPPGCWLMSEFELYGHFLLRDAPDTIRMRPFSNVKLKSAEFLQGPQSRWTRRFRFVSNHQHGI